MYNNGYEVWYPCLFESTILLNSVVASRIFLHLTVTMIMLNLKPDLDIIVTSHNSQKKSAADDALVFKFSV